MDDYAAYYPASGPVDAWGVRVTASGHTRITAGATYPPAQHPDDHALNWQRGRVLQAYQLVYITAGRGRFESAVSRRSRIEAGTVFLLFPGVWHRYEPSPKAGWSEDWLELEGPALDRLRRAGVLRPDRPLYRPGVDPTLIDLFGECHRVGARAPKGYPALLGLLGLQFLAHVVHGPQRRMSGPDGLPEVNAMRALINQAVGKRTTMEGLADEAGLSYSSVRRAFRAHTGVTLKQHHVHVRRRRAQELLLNTQLSVKEIAARLGFDSPFHFSADFKRHTGVSPQPWRAQARARGRNRRSGRV